MTNNVAPGEIVFCDLLISHKDKKNKTTKHELKRVVYKNKGGLYYKKRILDKLKINEAVKVESVKVIARLGFENKIL